MIAVENRNRTCSAHMMADAITDAFGKGVYQTLATVPDPNNPSVQLNLPNSDIRTKIWQSIYYNQQYAGKRKEELYPIYIARWRDYLMSLPEDKRGAVYSTSVASATSTIDPTATPVGPSTATAQAQIQNSQQTGYAIAANPNAPRLQNTQLPAKPKPQAATISTNSPQGNAVPWWYYAAGAAALYLALLKK